MRATSLLAIGFALCGLEAHAASIIFVTNASTGDDGYVQFLENNGYTVNVRTDLTTLDATKVAALNAADLVIVSRNTSSGSFIGEGGLGGATKQTEWNNITTPLLLHNPYLIRSGHWAWVDNTSAPANQSVSSFTVTTAGTVHPIFDGATGELFSSSTNVGFNPSTTAGNGVMLATGPADRIAIAEWQGGSGPYYTGSPQSPGGDRVFFTLGPDGGDNLNYFATLSPNGQQVLLNTVEYLIPEPSSSALVLIAGMGLVFRRRRAA